MPEFFDRLESFRAAASVDPRAIRQVARWKITPEALSLTPQSSGQDIIRVDQETQSTFRGLIASIAPAVADAFNEHLLPIAQRAFDRWPVDTGVSKSLLFLTFTPSQDGSSLIASLGNRAPYAHLIFRGRTEKAKDRARKTFDELHSKAQENILKAKQRRQDREARQAARDERLQKAGVRTPKRRKRGQRRSPRAGEVTNKLIFVPGEQAAEKIANDIAADVARGV